MSKLNAIFQYWFFLFINYLLKFILLTFLSKKTGKMCFHNTWMCENNVKTTLLLAMLFKWKCMLFQWAIFLYLQCVSSMITTMLSYFLAHNFCSEEAKICFALLNIEFKFKFLYHLIFCLFYTVAHKIEWNEKFLFCFFNDSKLIIVVICKPHYCLCSLIFQKENWW